MLKIEIINVIGKMFKEYSPVLYTRVFFLIEEILTGNRFSIESSNTFATSDRTTDSGGFARSRLKSPILAELQR